MNRGFLPWIEGIHESLASYLISHRRVGLAIHPGRSNM